MNHVHYIIIKNLEASKTKYFGANNWTYKRDEATLFEGLADAMKTVNAIDCDTASVVSA